MHTGGRAVSLGYVSIQIPYGPCRGRTPGEREVPVGRITGVDVRVQPHLWHGLRQPGDRVPVLLSNIAAATQDQAI